MICAVNMNMPTLYIKNTCYYCQKVLDFVHTYQIDISVKDTISDPMAKEELLKLGGKCQVPFLFDPDKTSLYESEKIISYLRSNYAG